MAESVEVVYALADAQTLVEIGYVEGLTALQAFERSGLGVRFPEILRRPLVLGCFGVEVAYDYVVKRGDRIEICRPLCSDPRERRKALSRLGRVMSDS